MDTRTLLADRIAHGELCPGTRTLEDWLRSSWVRFRFGQRFIPLIPLWGLKKAHVAHDVHHAVLDYPTTLRAECELAAWELASGGCGWNLFFWFDRSVVFALGLLVCPIAMCQASRRGWRHRNLYGTHIDEILATDVDDLRRRMRL